MTGLTQAIAAFDSEATESGAGDAGSLTGAPPTGETIGATVSAMTVAMANYNPNGSAGSQAGPSPALPGTSVLDNEPDNPLAIPSNT